MRKIAFHNIGRPACILLRELWNCIAENVAKCCERVFLLRTIEEDPIIWVPSIKQRQVTANQYMIHFADKVIVPFIFRGIFLVQFPIHLELVKLQKYNCLADSIILLVLPFNTSENNFLLGKFCRITRLSIASF